MRADCFGVIRVRPLALPLALLGLSVTLVQGPAAAAPSTQTSGQSLSQARAEAEALRGRLSELRRSSGESISRLEHAEDELGAAVTRSVSLGRELDAARSAARGSDGQLRRRVSALYRSGGAIGLWSTLLDASTPAELVSRVANVDAVVAADARLRTTARQGSGRLEVLEAAARDNAAERTRLAKVAEVEVTRIAASMAEQTAALAGATDRVRVLVEEQRRAAAAAAARRLAQQQAAARAAALAAASLPGGLPSSGALPGPVGPAYAGPPGVCPVGPVHSFADTWHAPRSGGRQHQGTDVFAPYGSPAYAVVDGVIDKWSDGGLGGIALWLRGDDGDRYYYAHNAANIAQVGQRVRAGEQIAYVGTTGNAATTPPHIHFEAHFRGGPPTNPYPWLAAICAA